MNHQQHNEHHPEQMPQSMDYNMMGYHSAANTTPLDISAMFLLFMMVGILFARKVGTKLPLAALSQRRFNLFKIPGFRKIVKFRYFPFFICLIPTLLLILVIVTGLFGNPQAGFAAGIVWLLWWTALVFMVAFGGKIFCAICPWDFFANLIQFGPGYKKKKSSIGLNLGWPKAFANIYPATAFFIFITWLELGFDITRNSFATAVLALLVLLAAIAAALLFKRRAFCRFACPMGRIGGMYAEIAPLELRVEDPSLCEVCETKDCVKGTDHSSACPTWQIPYKMQQSTYCTLCTECIRSCPFDNLALKIRPIASDMGNIGESRRDEAVLIVALLVLSYFHGITMTPLWFTATDFVSTGLNLNYTWALSLLMTLILAAFLAFFRLCEKFLKTNLGEGREPYILGYALIPMALGYHLGHNSMHFFSEISNLVPMMADPFGFGWDLFGLTSYEPRPFFTPEILKYVQLVCVATGFYYAVKVLRLRSELVSANKADMSRIFFFGFAVLLLLGIAALWLIDQPMMMKTIF